jgi:hypothetical protein
MAEAQPGLAHVGAGLVPTPRRVTLSGENPTGTVELSASERAVYDVSFVDRTMRPDGQIVSLEEGTAVAGRPDPTLRSSAKPFLAVTARQVIVEPGRTARVQVRLVRAPIRSGEYRTHLTFTALDAPEAPSAREGPAMVWAHSIPVIVRVGPPVVGAAIENARTLAADAGDPMRRRLLSFDLVRLGSNSIFGDIAVKDRQGRTIGGIQGIAVYPEIGRRRITLPLQDASAGTAHITFTDRDTRPGQILASLRFNLSHRRIAGSDALAHELLTSD